MIKTLIFIPTYLHENFIEATLTRIPVSVFSQADVAIFDDASKDKTFEVIQNFKNKNPQYNIKVFKNKTNQQYGGNQKLAYTYAIKNGYDIVIMLHGDGQYAPEYLPEIIRKMNAENLDMLNLSRMINKRDALKGNMPKYKFLGNIVLSRIQNMLIGSNFSEYYSGYRAYRISILKKIPFMLNSNYFDFDGEILVQLHLAKAKISEMPIKTFYGKEISRVRVIKNGLKNLYHSILGMLHKFGVVKVKKYIVNQ